MDITHLSYFSVLCETLNYTAAAKKCFISRQAMRQSLQVLEQTYGLPLIENHRNHLSVTPAGKLLYDKIQPVLGAYRELDRAMNSCIASDSVLRIGISRSITPYYAPDVLSFLDRFAESYPGIPVEILLLPADELADKLENKNLDAGILVEMWEPEPSEMDARIHDWYGDLPASLPAPLPQHRRTVLRTDVMTILVSASHPLAKRDSLALQELDGQTVMLMGSPERFFRPLYHAVHTFRLRVNWKVVPDYYEVAYHILQGDCLAIDRPVNSAFARRSAQTSVDKNLSLESDNFFLHCTLLTPPEENTAIQILRQTLEHMALAAAAAPSLIP